MIERMFGRLKDFRRIATRYDRLARNYLAAICLAATICYWLSVRTVTQTTNRLNAISNSQGERCPSLRSAHALGRADFHFSTSVSWQQDETISS